MNIYIYTDRETGRIRRIDTRSPKDKTIEEIDAMIQEFNANPSNDLVERIEADGIIGEAFTFLMGEKPYRKAYKLTDLVDQVTDLRKELEEIKDDVGGVMWNIDSFLDYAEDKIDDEKQMEEEL